MQPQRARHTDANIDCDIDSGALNFAVAQKMLADVRMLLFAALYAVRWLQWGIAVRGPALGHLALVFATDPFAEPCPDPSDERLRGSL